MPLSSRASLVLATTAIEVGLKRIILEPVVYGLVHDESIAGLITDLVVSARQSDYRKLLLRILADHGGVDLETFKREDGQKDLWEEIKDIQKRRNEIIHRAEATSEENASLAVAVATTIIEELFPRLIQYPLSLDDHLIIR